MQKKKKPYNTRANFQCSGDHMHHVHNVANTAYIHNRALYCGCCTGRTQGFEQEGSQDFGTDWRVAWCRQTHVHTHTNTHTPLQSPHHTTNKPPHQAWFTLLQTSSYNREMP